MKSHHLVGILTSGLVLVSTAFSQQGGTIVKMGKNNALTAAENSDGYKLLWNGLDFTGWKSYHLSTVSGSWAVVNQKGVESGDKHRSADPDSNILEVTASGLSMFTSDTGFRDFDWKVEWQAPATLQGNSGLIIHYREAAGEYNGASGPECQVANDKWTSEWRAELTTAGCDYEMFPLLKTRKNADNSPNWTQPSGQWNQVRIISYGNHVAHYGNGLRLLEYQMFTPAWEAAFQASKYKNYPNYHDLHPGSIYLQDHGQPQMKFRNIRVKKLTQNPWGPNSPYLNKTAAAAGDSSLVDNLSFAEDLFPASVNTIPPYAIMPKEATITTNKDGVSVLFSQFGDYSLRVQDVKGVTTSKFDIHGADHFFLPVQSAQPRILTVWKGDKKIQESVIGAK